MATEAGGSKRKEIYTYTAPWLIYGMNWSVRADQRFRLAIGSFEEEYSNSVRVIQLDEETHKFVDIGGFEHPYPTTKIMWMPDPNGSRRVVFHVPIDLANNGPSPVVFQSPLCQLG